MAKIRTVKPDLFRHEELFESERKYQLPLRLAFIGLLTCCDREGRFRWKPRTLKLDVLPYDDAVDFSQVLEALWRAGFIKKYRNEEKYYGYIPSWHHHQSINKREPASKLPDPVQCPTESYSVFSTVDEKTALSIKPFENISVKEQQETKIDLLQPETIVLGSQQAVKENFQERLEAEPATDLRTTANIDEKLSVETSQKSCLVSYESCQTHQIAKERLNKPYTVTSDEIITIFHYWKNTFHHPKAILDKKRYRLIRQALQLGYSLTDLCEAVNGCALTPHNMGQNEAGQYYDVLHIIFGSADQIDRFIRNFKSPPKGKSGLDRRTQTNVTHLQNWLDKKMQTQERHQSA